ncbi:2OG-Fe(II) oxygenase [Mycena olivaceomarginata]|nr:2OG-Fe(II) oxygenase [Mycena olivaceomarginata]
MAATEIEIMCVTSQYASHIPHLLTPEEIIQQIRRAYETVGLFYVKNHGIPEEVLQRCIDESAKFFSLSDDTKMALWQEDPVLFNMGYRPSRDSKIDPKGTHDLVEGFTLKWEESRDGESGNKWPAARTRAQARNLLYHLIALAMGVEEDYFTDKTKSNASRMRLLRYPAQMQEVVSGGAHSDFGTFTILLQQPGIEALQVIAPKTGWTFIPPIAGTLIVNLGDQSTICTNGAFRSPVHRVFNRPGPARHSIPLFFLADPDVVLKPHESFITPEKPRQYEPMTSGEQFAKRIADAGVEK